MSWPEPTDADLGCTCDRVDGEFCSVCGPEFFDADAEYDLTFERDVAREWGGI